MSGHSFTSSNACCATPGVARAARPGNYEETFNLPYLAESCGAVFVARYTAYHVRHTAKAIKDALLKRGFSFVEVLAPCPTLFSRRNKLGDGRDQMIYYKEQSEIKNDADTKTVGLTLQGKSVCGTFVNKDKPTYLDSMNAFYAQKFGDKYAPYKG